MLSSPRAADQNPQRVVRGNVVIYEATAYVYEGSPLRADKQLHLRLPLHIGQLLLLPERYITASRTLRRACNRGLLAADRILPDEEDVQQEITTAAAPTRTRTKKLQPKPKPFIAGETRKKTGVHRYDVLGIFEWKHLRPRNGGARPVDTVPLTEARYQCVSEGGRLPRLASYDEYSRLAFAEYLRQQHILRVIVDTEYDPSQGEVLFPTIEEVSVTLQAAFPEKYHLKPKTMQAQFQDGKVIYVQGDTHVPMWKHFNDVDLTVYYTENATMEVAHSNTKSSVTGFAIDTKAIETQNDRMQNYDRRHMPVSAVVCEFQIPEYRKPEATRVDTTPDRSQYLALIQACYDSAAAIEQQGIKYQLRLVALFEQHHMEYPGPLSEQLEHMEPSLKIAAQSSSSDCSLCSRQKRYLPSLTPLSTGWYATHLINVIRGKYEKEKEKEKPVAHLGVKYGISQVSPYGRPGTSKLEELTRRKSGRPLSAWAQAGAGYGLWPFYDPRQIGNGPSGGILDSLKDLEVGSTRIQQIRVETREVLAAIDQLAREVNNTNYRLDKVESEVDLLKGITALQHVFHESTMHFVTLNTEAEETFNDIREILSAIIQNQIPAIFNPHVADAIDTCQAAGKKVAPAPTRPVFLDPKVQDGNLIIYARFFVGNTDWELYEIFPLPRFYQGVAYTRRLTYHHVLLDIDQVSYIALDHFDVLQCRQSACPHRGVAQPVAEDPCGIRGINAVAFDPKCEITESPGKPYIQSVQGGFLYSVPQPLKARLNCLGETPWHSANSEKIFTLEGIGYLEVPEGCKYNIDPATIIYGPPISLHPNRKIPEQAKRGMANLDEEFLEDLVKEPIISLNRILLNQYVSIKNRVRRIFYACLGITAGTVLAFVGCTLAFAYARISRTHVKQRVKEQGATQEKRTKQLETGQSVVRAQYERMISAIRRNYDSIFGFLQHIHRFLGNRTTFGRYLQGETQCDLPRTIPLLDVESQKETIKSLAPKAARASCHFPSPTEGTN